MNRAELQGRLDALELQDELERTHRDTIRQLLTLPGDVCSREHYEPGHLTASAFILSPDDSSLLLIHHAKLKRWLQPGGHIEATDASMVDAARREAREETGLDGLELLGDPFDLDVHEIPAHGQVPAHRHFDVRFLFRARTRAVRGNSEALDARWFELRDLESMASDESVWRAVRKLRHKAHLVGVEYGDAS